METRRYTFKLYPNKAQAEALEHQAVLCVLLWNAALEQREIQWAHECQRKAKGERKGLSRFDQQKEVKFIRNAAPEFAAMSSATLALVLKSLDLAFQAFFRRAKSGAGKSSGYPRYKSSRHADTIPHRDRAGWKLEANGGSFKIYAKGIPGLIKARGKFPAEPSEIRTMTLMKRDGAWWASIVVRMAPRRSYGTSSVLIDMDLIDTFAVVKNRDNGQCLAGLTVGKYPSGERITQINQTYGVRPPVASGDLEGNDRMASTAAPSGDLKRDGWSEVQSQGDRHHKKFSYRWRQNRKRIARLRAKEARRRAHVLHNWSSRVIAAASCIEVSAPQVSDVLKSPRGDSKNPGAAVKTGTLVNKTINEYAPASAIAMLEYKAAEAGIPFAVRISSEHPAYIGRDISHTAKLERKARRSLKKMKG